MKRFTPCLLFVLVFPQMTWAAPPIVKGSSTYKEHEPIVLKATEVTSKAAQFLWDVEGAQFVEAGDTLYVWAAPGDYLVRLTTIDFESKKVERTRFKFTVEGARPPPVPPVPPGPVPPAPPGPAGTFDRVLILYDSANLAAMPRPQEAILYDARLREYLKARTPADKDNPGGAWKIWDKGVDASAAGKAWVDLMGRPHASMPWITVSGPSGILFDGPLPGTVADTLTLLGKYTPKLRKAG